MWSSFQCTIVIYLVMNAFINVCLIQGIETVNVKNSFSKQWNSGLQNPQSLEYWIPLFIVENWAEFIIFSEAAEHLGSVLNCKSGKPASSVARAILWFSSDNCSMSRCASDVFVWGGELCVHQLCHLDLFSQVKFVVCLYCQQTIWKRD